MLRATDDAWFPAACVLAGYVAIAQGLGSLYPFSTFEMYAGGSTHEIRDYEAYRCDSLDLQPAACREHGEYYTIGYVEREAQEYLSTQASAPAHGDEERVQLVRRIWRFEGPKEPAVEDCALSTCRAVRR